MDASAPVAAQDNPRSEDYYRTKSMIFGALIEAIDLAQLSRLEPESAREEIRDIVSEIIGLKNIVLSIAEQEELLDDICNDVLGYGPLEPLLARDDIADIMINGANRAFIEVSGKIQLTNVRFRDNQQLMNICQRIVSQVGRRVDDASPICDARLPDGSRVNVIAPPLAIDGPALTIRKFKKDKLTLDQLVRFGAISPEGAEILKIIGRSRCNIVISGGTGSGKTTLLNCITAFIENDERIITCEDAAELQLQQPHVVRLETRPPNMEGQGQVTMRDLVKNCLRMRPERIIVGEVRGPEAFDLLQAMNTGHDGSMGTLHANSPRECLSRIESMISMGGFTLPSKTLREMICGSIDVVVQATRLRDGSRRITHITEVLGMEGDVITTQDIFLFDILGEDANGKLIGRHRSTGVGRPKFWERARYYGLERQLGEALDAAAAAGGAP
ncbi:CpaF family protein [Methylobacterium sp. WL103]|nr:CpaF family protein [Methylobacterium sp. WL103]TXN01907.1 CpaF family protein [Methylobacterium sp. WL103]